MDEFWTEDDEFLRAPSRVSPEAETGWPPLLRGPRCCGGVVVPHGSKPHPRESEGAPSLWPRNFGARVLQDAAPLPGSGPVLVGQVHVHDVEGHRRRKVSTDNSVL